MITVEENEKFWITIPKDPENFFNSSFAEFLEILQSRHKNKNQLEIKCKARYYIGLVHPVRK